MHHRIAMCPINRTSGATPENSQSLEERTVFGRQSSHCQSRVKIPTLALLDFALPPTLKALAQLYI
jgi:hypothetical protein